MTENNFTCKYLSEYLWQLPGVAFVSDVKLSSNQSHVDTIACVESSDDIDLHSEHLSKSSNLASEKLNGPSIPVMNVHPKEVNVVNDSGFTDRILLVLVLVLLCIICVNVVAKNVIAFCKRTRRGTVRSVSYIRDSREFDSNSVEAVEVTSNRSDASA